MLRPHIPVKQLRLKIVIKIQSTTILDTMRHLFTNMILCVILLTIKSGCASNDWENVPGPVAQFLSQYFPLQAVTQCNYQNDTYHVKLRNSSALTFDDRYKWTSVNGYGNTLPEMFLFDQLPPALYNYLQELSFTTQVYAVTRDSIVYNVMLSDHSVTYTIATGVVTPDKPESTSPLSIAPLRGW